MLVDDDSQSRAKWSSGARSNTSKPCDAWSEITTVQREKQPNASAGTMPFRDNELHKGILNQEGSPIIQPSLRMRSVLDPTATIGDFSFV